MDCIGIEVKHGSLGKGVVVDQYDRFIEVEFQDRISKFLYPLSFEKYLVALDPEIQSALIDECISFDTEKHEDEEIVFSNAVSYMTLKDGTEVLYTVSSSLKTVRVHFFNIENRVAKVACIELPQNKWIKCLNYDDKEIAEIRLFCAMHSDEIIKQATMVSPQSAYHKNQEYLEDVKKKEAAFEIDSEEYVEQILNALSSIQNLADTSKYAYSIDTNVRGLFHRIEMAVQAAKDAFVLEPTNRISFYNLRGENDGYNFDGTKKYLYCPELNCAYKTSTRAAADTGFNAGNINTAAKGGLRSVGGFHWEYRAKEDLPENVIFDIGIKDPQGQLDIQPKDAYYYANLPYKKEYFVNDEGTLCFRIPNIPRCEKRITFPALADEIINETILSTVKRALENGDNIKGLSELILKKKDKPLCMQSAIWPDLFPIQLKPKVVVEVVRAGSIEELADMITEKVNALEMISQELCDNDIDIQVIPAGDQKAFIIFEGVVWLKS